MDPLRKKWKDAKRAKLKYYITNINLKWWVLYKTRRLVDHIQPYLISNMSIVSIIRTIRAFAFENVSIIRVW